MVTQNLRKTEQRQLMGDELLPIINKAFVFDFAEMYVYL